MPTDLIDEACGMSEQLVAWRRHLHAHPELSGAEEQTAAFVAERLGEMGLTPRCNIGGMNGVVADLVVADQPFVALRADMDALPIQEENDVDYASETLGVMHACGHDAHMAMLLGAARILQHHRSELHRSVRLIFQPHEENEPGGAPAMIRAGVLEGVESIFGLHIWAALPTGRVGTRVGAFMASPTLLEISIHGKGGHAAMPEECIDPIVIAAQVIVGLQMIVSRTLGASDAGVVTITRINAGTTHNVIPQSVELAGTIRTFDTTIRDRVSERVREIAQGTAKAHGARADVKISHSYPTLINDPVIVADAHRAAERAGFDREDIVDLPLQGGGEDFAYYCQEVPGAFMFLGAGNPAIDCGFPHHHPRFNIDEAALPRGAAVLAAYCLQAGG